MNTNSITRGAIIGGLYFSLVLLFQPISFGGAMGLQLRVSEFLTVLPFFFPEAVIGLTIGCVLANFLSQFGWIDIVFGSLCTLIAAFLTYSLRWFKKPRLAYVGVFPPIIINALGVGLYVSILATPERVFSWKMYGLVSLSIFIGQSLSVGIGGSLLITYLLRKGAKIK
jgi:uncharacterized membrane protein